MKDEVRINFESLFPHLVEGEPSHFTKFRKIHKVLRKTAAALLRKEFKEVSVFDLVDARGELREDLVTAVSGYYRVESTRSSQLSVLSALVEAELKEVDAGGRLHPGAAKCGLVDPERLPPHIRQIWDVLPRAWSGKWQRVPRAERPVTGPGREFFRIVIEVSETSDTEDLVTLLKGGYDTIIDVIKTSVAHDQRKVVRWAYFYVRQQLGIRLKGDKVSLEIEQLGPKLAKALQTFLKRAPLGLGAYPELKSLARDYKYQKIKGLAPTTINNYRAVFLTGVAHMALPDDVGIEDLLRLQTREIKVEGGDTTEELFNPHFDKYRSSEKVKVKPGVKESGFDTGMVSVFCNAVTCIGRFNGHFKLAKSFSAVYTPELDYESRVTRKLMKKKRWSRQWIDAEIRRLKGRFDQVVKKKSFLRDSGDLMIVLYLPQLVVLRFLGFRQQCLRKCAVGRNIIFGPGGSITFHYERHEIKNEVAIHQTLSMESHGGLEEIVILLDVLEKYYFQVLKVIRSRFPAAFRVDMGDAFFAAPAGLGEKGLIARYPAEDEKQSFGQRARAEKLGVCEFHHWFTYATYELIDFSAFKDFREHFNPHFLRGVCCDWMRKDLGWSWEEIEQAMGDREATLKGDYYYEGRRVQDASDSFARSSRERREKEEENRRVTSSVPAEVHGAMQQTLIITTERLREETIRRAELEGEVSRLRMMRDFLLGRAGMTMDALSECIDLGLPAM